MYTEEQIPWMRYTTYDEDGFVNGVRDDAPDEIKKAYEQHQKKIQEYIDKGMLIPR